MEALLYLKTKANTGNPKETFGNLEETCFCLQNTEDTSPSKKNVPRGSDPGINSRAWMAQTTELLKTFQGVRG